MVIRHTDIRETGKLNQLAYVYYLFRLGLLYVTISSIPDLPSALAARHDSTVLWFSKAQIIVSFLSETCLLKDALRYLKQLSLYSQGQDANILNAGSYIDDAISKLQGLK